MNRRLLSWPRFALLLLMLAIGPLQAQTVFACAMMDTVVVGDCCCDDHEAACSAPDCDGMAPAAGDPCCERSVAVTIDEDARQNTPQSRPVAVDSNVDPPPAFLATTLPLALPQRTDTTVACPVHVVADHSGSDTWLITQRLRI